MARQKPRITTVITDLDMQYFEQPLFNFARVHCGCDCIDPVRIANLDVLIDYEHGRARCGVDEDRYLAPLQLRFQLHELAGEGIRRSWEQGARSCLIVAEFEFVPHGTEFYEEVERVLLVREKVQEFRPYDQLTLGCLVESHTMLLISEE